RIDDTREEDRGDLVAGEQLAGDLDAVERPCEANVDEREARPQRASERQRLGPGRGRAEHDEARFLEDVADVAGDERVVLYDQKRDRFGLIRALFRSFRRDARHCETPQASARYSVVSGTGRSFKGFPSVFQLAREPPFRMTPI